MLAAQITDAELNQRFSSLTERQMGILSDAGQGYSNREIAERNAIKVGTVKQHMHSIYTKLGAGQKSKITRPKALALLYRHQAVQPLRYLHIQRNTAEVTLRFQSQRLEALIIKDEDGGQYTLIVDRD